ncbi:hypothetical protein ACQPZF_24630 [Actinosynnema sp. CS-041913]|uniref:hypothetical protein n=1 Tax=Actinosynnema sp. CS-041913 TaxID=3239917 RepID=UPI003D8CAA8F
MTLKTSVATTAAAVLATAGLLTTTALPAEAVTRRKVCAQSVWVRDNPAGHAIAILYNGESFDYDHSAYHNGYQWAYGFAYGGENVWGWLPYEYLC